MFGQMQVTRMFQLSKLETVDEAVAKLLEFAEYPKILRWFSKVPRCQDHFEVELS